MQLTLIPFLLILPFAVALGWAWIVTRGRFVHLGPLAAGFGIFAAAMLSQFFLAPPVVSASLYAGGAMLISHGIAARSGILALPPALLGLTAAVVAGIAVFSYLDNNVLARVYVLNFGLGAIFLYPALRVGRLVRGSAADRILSWTVLLVGLHFFPRTLLTAGAITSADATSFTGSPYWIAAIYASTFCTVLLSLSVMFATMLDIVTALQTDRDTDHLTGVCNRRGLDWKMSALLCKANGRPATLIICDIDYFKRINDRWGHPAGDLVLKVFAQTLREGLRLGDVVARIGGEEFVIVLPKTALADGTTLAERIRHAVANMDLSQIAPNLSITCSLGVVEVQEEEAPWAAVRRADELLYAAKRYGRNRVVTDLMGASPFGRGPDTAGHVRQISEPLGFIPPDKPPTLH